MLYFFFHKIDDEEGPLIFSLIQNHFFNIQKIKSLPADSIRRPSLVPIVRKTSIIREIILNSSTVSSSLSENEISSNEELTFGSPRPRRESRKLSLQQALNLSKDSLINLKKSDAYMRKLSIYEEKSIKLSPTIDGRILCIKDKDVSLSNKICWFHVVIIFFLDC